MKKALKYIIALVIGGMIFTSCENLYDNQTVALPGNYPQVTLQDTTGFAAVLKAGLSPLTISTASLTSPLSLLTCTDVLSRVDTTTRSVYRLDFSNVSTFANYKTIAITFDGKAGSDVKVGCKEFNDSIKTYNKNAVQRTVYIRLISFIKKNGLNAGFTSKTLSLLVTPNNYPPVAINDVATLAMNSSIKIAVLKNDTDPEKDALSIISKTTPGHGDVVINADSTLTYTPTTGYSGSDSFSYTISDGNGNTSTANVDVTILAVNPYNAVTLRPWFLIGAAIGDGNWNNSTGGLGVSIFPLSVVSGNVYNVTGDGQYTYTGYFQAGKGFKLIRDYSISSWNESWGMTGSTLVHNGGDNITVATDGYYTVSLNSITNTLTILPATAPTASYTSMGMIGEFAGSGWGTDIPMVAGQATNNHIWYTTFTFTTDFTPPVGNGGMKFRANGSWDHNWGDGYFPTGLGVNGGTNIPFKAGKYTIIFNDVDGSFYFIKVL
ncbi:MAG: Ig-like domain-containing protein [Paludibacter sp.]|nr:Ig-like domain-containing protein [Paludibacter sp.]